MMMHTMLACMEMCMMVAAIPLCMMLPGAMFAMWMFACACMVMAMCWMLNGPEQMHQCTAGSEGWMMGQDAEDEKWMFVGGMGTSSRHCHRMTLPMMSRLFSRPMTCICMPTYGLPFDMMMMMMQRCTMMPSQTRRNLYAQMRFALLDDSMHRCVVMCMNHSAVLVSQAVAQLCADLPAEKMRKLEIYTFGSAACEFMMPMGGGGSSMMDADMPMHAADVNNIDMVNEQRRGMHVEHFAMANDPFARMGVLEAVRRNMDGRFCGGVFIMNNANSIMMSNGSMMPSTKTNSSMMPVMSMMSTCGMTMEDYLCALFPSQMMSTMSSPPTMATTPRSVLDAVMYIDRDCAEKREITAMTNYHGAKMGMVGGMRKRLSWTGLAASNMAAGADKNMNTQKNGVSAGMVGLEMARKGCKDCSGHRGREVSWLVRYVNMGMVMDVKMGMGGMKGMDMKMGMGGMDMMDKQGVEVPMGRS
ncbi:hypothetical protein B0H67DRAFT_494367 [Lasiosphaeris hirsuta]|uniref:Uncharacterized protein n=1 Tax=Lasiosphaeris hirsuta TaxID=260670 RepID=A0AA40A1P5_9PEZI|nr:hypothetical protein B0H67DRAFT_494367 [Lasiosphaeris hirsuta]